MTSLIQTVCKQVGKYEDRNLLKDAVQKIDARITQLLEKEHIIGTIENRLGQWSEARHTAQNLTPLNALVLLLHELNCAEQESDPVNQKNRYRELFQDMIFWKNQIDQQQKAGIKLDKTISVYQQLELRINELDPDHSIRDEMISWSDLGDWFKNNVRPLLMIPLIFYVLPVGIFQFQQLIYDTSSSIFGVNVANIAKVNMNFFGIHMSLVGLEQSIRAKNILGISLSSLYLYSLLNTKADQLL